MEGNVIITKVEYLKLLLDAAYLRRLDEAGVDNWEYRDVYFEGWEDEKKEIKKKVEAMV